MVYPVIHTFGIADGNVPLWHSFDRLFGLSFAWLVTHHMRFNSVVALDGGITDNGGFRSEQSFGKRTESFADKISQVLHAQTSARVFCSMSFRVLRLERVCVELQPERAGFARFPCQD